MTELDSTVAISLLGLLVALLAAVYARGSAVSAAESASISRQALVATQRAFVFAPQLDQLNFPDPATLVVQSIRITPSWRNAGISPAKRLATFTNIRSFEPGEAIEVDFPSPPDEAPMMDVAPGATFHGDLMHISAADLAGLKRGRKVFIWGLCEYSDAFDSTPRRRTEFCFEVVLALDPAVPVNLANAETRILLFQAAPNRNFAS